jgi:tripartite-type tricarboxylate transporter receptor subunit TctC
MPRDDHANISLSRKLSCSWNPLARAGYIRAGKLRALAVTTARRLEVLPDLPILSDFVPGYEASSLNGIGVPKNTPVEIIGRLNTAINAILADRKIEERLADLGGVVLRGSPDDFGSLVIGETTKWGKVATSIKRSCWPVPGGIWRSPR